jgi:hypothetical protein
VEEKELKQSEKDVAFAAACDELKEKFKLKRLIVNATPEEGDHELVFMNMDANTLWIVEAAVNLLNFYMKGRIDAHNETKKKALGMLALLEKMMVGKSEN